MIIWIASYPRSGNTFLRVVLKSVFGLDTYSIYDDKSAIGRDAATAEVVGHKMLPEDFDVEAARKSEDLYLVKTHDVIPVSDDKVIYLIRDGRQSMLSYMNYIRSFHDDKCEIQDVLFGNVPFGSWEEHVESWAPKIRDNTLLLKFEELTASPQSLVADISDFIGVEALADDIPGFEELHSINPKFFRQGKSDSWRTELPQDDLNMFWMSGIFQMQEFYPEEELPDLFSDADNALKFSRYFQVQGKYFKNAITDIRSELSEKEKNLESLNLKIRDLQDKRREINSAAASMVDLKAWKQPVQKYRAYKNLLKILFSAPSE